MGEKILSAVLILLSLCLTIDVICGPLVASTDSFVGFMTPNRSPFVEKRGAKSIAKL